MMIMKSGTREDTVRLIIPCVQTGKERKLMGAYAHHAELDFHRRTYHEIGSVKGPRFDEIHVVKFDVILESLFLLGVVVYGVGTF
jgi:hypothetical protein